MTELFPASDQMNALNLPDFCLRKIFAYLNQNDLAAVAEVCRRFQSNAQEYSSKFRHVDFFVNNSGERPRSFPSLLRNFGASIESITLIGALGAIEQERLIINGLHEYCNRALTKMTLRDFDSSAISEILIFDGVRELELDKCALDERFLIAVTSLFPTLSKLALLTVEIDGIDLLIDAVAQIGTLKVLEISNNVDLWRLQASHIYRISGQLGELTELRLYNNGLSLSSRNLLDMISNLSNLQLLLYDEPKAEQAVIDRWTFLDMLEIVRERDDKAYLKYITDSHGFGDDLSVGIVRRHRGTVELVQQKYTKHPLDN